MKPCIQCGIPLQNNAEVCNKCGSEQTHMPAFPAKPIPPSTPHEQTKDKFFYLIEAIAVLLPIILGIIGYCVFNATGAIVGILIGVAPWFIFGIN